MVDLLGLDGSVVEHDFTLAPRSGLEVTVGGIGPVTVTVLDDEANPVSSHRVAADRTVVIADLAPGR